MFEMKKLDFEMNALEPYMSARTLEFHYGKHYKAYVDKLNELIKDTVYEKMSLEEIVKESRKHPEHKAIYNNAGQVWNHEFFWKSLSPANEPLEADKMKQIEKVFGSYDNFKATFKQKALSQFGSGWCWLVEKDGKLDIITTGNADSPLSLETGRAIVCLDVWEHAYYLDYQNRRGDFAEAFLNNLIKW